MEDTAASTAANTPAQNSHPQEQEIVDPSDTHVEIRAFTVGPIETNCYALISDGHALVVDPGAAGAAIVQHLNDVTVDLVVATHGHGDHVGGVKALIGALGGNVPFAIGAADAERAMKAGGVGNLGVAYDDDAPEPSRLLHEGDTITVGQVTLVVVDAPGHTEGGIILLGDGIAFTGDTLFKGTAGRTDFPGGDADTLAATLERLKGLLPADTVVLPGHGDASTMEEELASNPFLK